MVKLWKFSAVARGFQSTWGMCTIFLCIFLTFYAEFKKNQTLEKLLKRFMPLELVLSVIHPLQFTKLVHTPASVYSIFIVEHSQTITNMGAMIAITSSHVWNMCNFKFQSAIPTTTNSIEVRIRAVFLRQHLRAHYSKAAISYSLNVLEPHLFVCMAPIQITKMNKCSAKASTCSTKIKWVQSKWNICTN